MPLTPVMRWTRERGGPQAHHHQSLLVHTPAGLTEDRLVTALQAVIDHHDALRMRLHEATESLCVRAAGSVAARDRCRRVDVGALDPATRAGVFAEHAAVAAGLLDPECGILVQAVLFAGGPDQSGHLLLTVHHLAVDGVSWRILLADLAAAATAVMAGRHPSLDPVGTSFRTWAKRQLDAANAPASIAELPLWTGMLAQPEQHFGVRPLDPARDVRRSARTVSLHLPTGPARTLLAALPAAFHANVDEVLLTGFVLALRQWRTTAGHVARDVLVDVERHGRTGTDLDLSRTVGWFTSIHPVRLDLPAADLTDAGELADAVKRIKETFRAIPDNGIGFGLLRYLNSDTAARLSGLARPQIAFNYLGRFATLDPSATAWTPAAEGEGLRGGGDPDMPFAHAIEITAYTEDGAAGPRLVLSLSWPDELFAETETRELLDRWSTALVALAEPLGQPGFGGHSPADFPLVSLAQHDIDELERAHPAIVDVWPAGPLQQGLLFHALYDRPAPEVYTVQIAFDLPHWLSVSTFRAAIAAMLARHPNLRVGMWVTGQAGAVQFVPDTADPQWTEIEFAGSDERKLAEFMAADRVRRFDMTEPPLLRLTGIRLGADRYRVVLTCHHLLLDGWSMPLFARELLALAGSASELPAPARYRDYLAWLIGRDRDAAERAWAGYLTGLADQVPLVPSGWNRTPLPVEDIPFELGVQLTDKLRAAAAASSLTMNTIVQGAWGLLLAWLGGGRDVVFGSTVAGRPPDVDGIESMIGFFLNVVPVRVRVEGATAAAGMLARIQHEQSELIEHHHLDLASIQRIAGRAELFDSVIVFENFPVTAEAIAAAAEFADYECHHSLHFPLALVVYPDPGTGMRLRFRPDLFDSDRVRSIVDSLRTVLWRIADDPQQATSAVIALTSDQRRTLAGYSVGARTRPPAHLLPESIEEQAARTPHRIALRHGDEELSFAELNERANRLAHRLIAHGVGPEQRVALCLPRSTGLVIAMLAVLKAGAAYLPVDPRHPEQYRQQLLADAQPSVVLTEHDLDDDETAASTNPADADRVAPLDRAHPAYVLYTSGSTGRAKGVVVEHAALIDFCRWFVTEMGTERLSHVVAATSASFDVSVLELFPPLLVGGAIELIPDLRSVSAGPDTKTRPASLVSGVPSAFAALGANAPAYRAGTVVCAGESLHADVIDGARAFFGADDVLNLYGPTEATVCATRWRSVETAAGPVPIGRPRWNTTVAVLDDDLTPVPPGARGELYIAGAGLARGYLDDPAQTAERFLPDPYGLPGTRMYRTGDLARWNADGQLEFAGRRDDQVKVRGFRVEPAEVEAALRGCPGVTGAAVVAHGADRGDMRLVGYVVARQRAGIERDILAHCRDALPAHLVPAAVVVLDTLPTTANGKLDRHALPPPAVSASHSGRPPTATETYLATVLAEILDVPSVGTHDSLTDLGGHSLHILRLAGQLRADHGVGVDLADLMAHRTVAELATVIEATKEKSRTGDVVQLYQRFPYPSADAEAQPIFDLANGMAFCLSDEELDGWRVADIGCGTGHRVVALAQRYPMARFVGIDPAQSSLAVARRLALRNQVTNVDFRCGAIPDADLPGSFDLIVCSGVVHHLPDPEAGLAWLGRRLGPAGLLFLWLYDMVGEYDRLLDRELAMLLADGPADLAVVRELGLSLSPTRYGATAKPAGELTPDAADAMAADAYLNPVVAPYRFVDMRRVLESLSLDWIAGSGVHVDGDSRLLDLSRVERDGPWYVRAEDEIANGRLRSQIEAMPNHEKATAIELSLRPSGLSVLAGRRPGLARCLPRIRGNILFERDDEGSGAQ
ncbi:amino acid adenylation domain-containing protein [Amycolatopsis sp. NPDC000740]|uniref:amino acid adenylation domain-containing protein n=1 Tax=Amycolatopsis sp. NPDC000740 TaxID=3154269 RepID=UPI0033204A0E